MPVSVQVLTRDLADKLGLAGRSGVRVTRVLERRASHRPRSRRHHHGGGRDARAGVTAVRLGSVCHDDPAVQDRIDRGAVGPARQRRSARCTVTLDASPRLPREMKKYEDRDFEFRVRDIAVADRPPPGLPGRSARRARRGGPRRRLGGARPPRRRRRASWRSTEIPLPTSPPCSRRWSASPARSRPPSSCKVRRGIRTFFVEMQTGAMSGSDW